MLAKAAAAGPGGLHLGRGARSQYAERMVAKLPPLLFLVAIVTGLAGCEESAIIGSCDTRTEGDDTLLGMCRTWVGEDNGDFESLCSGQGGRFFSEDCPITDDLIGTCQTDQGFGLTLSYYYYAVEFDVAAARAHCESRAACTFSCIFDET